MKGQTTPQREIFLCPYNIPKQFYLRGQLVNYSPLIDHLFISFSLNKEIDIEHAPGIGIHFEKDLLLK